MQTINKALFSAILFLLSISLPTDIHAQWVYGVIETTIFRFDLENCGQIEYFDLDNAPSEEFTDLAFHPNGNLYLNTEFALYIADFDNHVFDKIDDFNTSYHRVNSLVAHANGQLYGAGRVLNGFNGYVYEISPDDASKTILGLLPEIPAGDLVFHRGQLYFSTISNNLYHLNLESPEDSELVGSLVEESKFHGLVAHSSSCDISTLYGISSNAFYRINAHDASREKVCELNHTSAGLTMPSDYLGSDCCILTVNTLVDVSCREENAEMTAIVYGGVPPYSYSLDGINFQASAEFSDLMAGDYLLHVKDNFDCFFEDQIIIEIDDPNFIITTVLTTDANCGEDNATLQIFSSGGEAPVSFSIDGSNFQDEPLFEDLSSGYYTAYIKDNDSCITENIVQIEQATTLAINQIYTEEAKCDSSNAFIRLKASGGAPPYQYSIDGVNFQDPREFSDLAPGVYPIFALDNDDCLFEGEITVGAKEPIHITSLISEPGFCDYQNGAVLIGAQGGTSPYQYAVNGQNYAQDSSITNLNEGEHTVKVVDADGCAIDSSFSLDCDLITERCMIYSPNIFTPNGDGENDIFKIFSENSIQEMKVYSRWGQLVFSSTNSADGWDGTSKGDMAPSGVYIYHIIVDCEGVSIPISGDVSLLR